MKIRGAAETTEELEQALREGLGDGAFSTQDPRLFSHDRKASVFRIELPVGGVPQAFYLKLYPDKHERDKHKRRDSTSKREFENTERAGKLGLPAPPAAAWVEGLSVDGVACTGLVTREVAGLESLESLWSREKAHASQLRRKVIESLARAVRAIHDAGYHHKNLAPRNVLFDPREGSVVLVDWDELEPFGLRLPWARLARLGQMLSKYAHVPDRDAELHFYQVYFGLSGDPGRLDHWRMRRIRRAARQARSEIWERAIRRAREHRGLNYRLEAGALELCGRRDYASEALSLRAQDLESLEKQLHDCSPRGVQLRTIEWQGVCQPCALRAYPSERREEALRSWQVACAAFKLSSLFPQPVFLLNAPHASVLVWRLEGEAIQLEEAHSDSLKSRLRSERRFGLSLRNSQPTVLSDGDRSWILPEDGMAQARN